MAVSFSDWVRLASRMTNASMLTHLARVTSGSSDLALIHHFLAATSSASLTRCAIGRSPPAKHAALPRVTVPLS